LNGNSQAKNYALAALADSSYVDRLMVMLQSLQKYDAKAKLFVLCLDGSFSGLPLPHCEVFSLDNIGISPQVEKNLRKQYSEFQLACVLKSRFMAYLLQNKKNAFVFYADSDLYFTSSLAATLRHAKKHQIVLTPHLISCNLLPSAKDMIYEANLLATGFNNMGFFGLRNTSDSMRFLTWWFTRVQFSCQRNIRRGFFDDQKWADAIPYLFPKVQSSLNPGLNVAPWNLHERPLVKKGGSYEVLGEPLVFFHFSGFDWKKPKKLCRYLPLKIEDYPQVRLLANEYTQACVRMEKSLKSVIDPKHRKI